jgi:hypothetical protein
LHLAALAYASNKPDSISSKNSDREAYTAIQNNDTQGALMDLSPAMKSIDNIVDNLTSTTTAGR